MPGRTCLGSTASNGGNSKSCSRGFPSTTSSCAEAAIEKEREEEEEEEEEEERGKGVGEVDL